MREIDADFTAYVQAWQLPATKAAYLVCGDADSAERAARRAFVALALHWDHVRHGDPSAFVRRALYRAALDPGRAPAAVHAGAAERVTEASLRSLSPRQRAVVVLRCLDRRSEADTADILGLEPTVVRRDLLDALARLQPLAAAAPASGGTPSVGADPLTRLLRSASAEIREVDHAEGAWAHAVRRRRQVHRRALAALAAAALVVAGVTAVAASRSEGDSAVPEARTLTPLPSQVSAWRTSDDGIAYALAPPAGEEATTAELDVGLPGEIDPRLALRRASDGGGFGRPSVFADAVYLQRVSPGRWQPVLVWRSGDQLVVDTMQLVDVRTRSGATAPPLGVHAFANDRTAIAFPQPGLVVVLRTATGAVESIPVPSQWIERVWWFGGWLMAGSADSTWQIGNAPDRHPTRMPEAYGIREYRSDNGIPVLDDHVPYQRPMLVGWPMTQPYGPTVSSADRIASAFFVDGLEGRGIDGVRPRQVLVATEGGGHQRMLVLGAERPRTPGCCPVLGWTVEADLVYADSSPDGTWIMAWNVETGQVRRLSHWLTSDAVPPVMALGVRFTAG